MRKIILFLRRIPLTLEKFALKAIPVTTKLLNLLENDKTVFITDLIPGNADNELRVVLISLLKEFNSVLFNLEDHDTTRKAIVARFGAEIVSRLDGKKENISTYIQIFEQVYSKNKK